ncbi:MAG: hypothetical protein ACK4GN_17625 [Runella sp.]
MKLNFYLLLKAVAVCLVFSSCSLYAQVAKEDRNNYPRATKTSKNTTYVTREAPFVYSPHLSYREQKELQMAKKKVGGITWVVRSPRGKKPKNEKQPTFDSKTSNTNPELTQVEGTLPVTRYVLSDTIQN